MGGGGDLLRGVHDHAEGGVEVEAQAVLAVDAGGRGEGGGRGSVWEFGVRMREYDEGIEESRGRLCRGRRA